jgi:hypothetical protein
LGDVQEFSQVGDLSVAVFSSNDDLQTQSLGSRVGCRHSGTVLFSQYRVCWLNDSHIKTVLCLVSSADEIFLQQNPGCSFKYLLIYVKFSHTDLVSHADSNLTVADDLKASSYLFNSHVVYYSCQ